MFLEYSQNNVTLQFSDYDFCLPDRTFQVNLCQEHTDAYAHILKKWVHEGVPVHRCSVRGCKKEPVRYVQFNEADVRIYEGELLNQTGTLLGKIVRRSTRFCAACQKIQRCYIVRWPDGSITKPCVRGCATVVPGLEQIL